METKTEFSETEMEFLRRKRKQKTEFLRRKRKRKWNSVFLRNELGTEIPFPVKVDFLFYGCFA
jgi:hypothetical protein